MNRAVIVSNSSLQTYASSTLSFGTGDFTLMAMIGTTVGGPVISHLGSTGGGYLLQINADGSILFLTSDGSSSRQTLTGATTILDNDCHTVAGIRQGTALTVLIDGLAVAGTQSGTGNAPLNVDNNLALTMGRTQAPGITLNQFVGSLMNVSVWSVALSGDLLVQAAFARVTGNEPGLQGYWVLDADTNDMSPNQNPANIVGRVTFEYCLSCVWAVAANSYTFCQIANPTDSRAPSKTVTLSREIAVAAGAPALAFSIMADQDAPAFPTGVAVMLTDPTGHVYNQTEATETLTVVLSGDQPWAVMALNPAAGTWTLRVTSPAASAFHVFIQTVPSADVVGTSETALEPLFGASSSGMSARSLRGFWDVVVGVAVAAAMGVAVAVGVTVAVATAPAWAAVAAGVAVFASTALLFTSPAVFDVGTTGSLSQSTGMMAGMAGFVVAVDKLLLFDAGVQDDPATELVYAQRQLALYPKVTGSTFNKVQMRLVQNAVKRVPVKNALTSFASGYVTGNGHGLASYIVGWYVSGTSGPLEEILSTFGQAQFTAAEVTGKIIHLFACNCGAAGTDVSPGLGRAMVAGGAKAFFGYKIAYKISPQFPALFCAGDIEIDLAMMRGATCQEAYAAAITVFNDKIAELRQGGYVTAASWLVSDRDALVCPSTNAMYGSTEARLQIT